MVWVIDPLALSIAVLTPDRDELILGSGDVLDGGDVLPGFTLVVDELFAQMQA